MFLSKPVWSRCAPSHHCFSFKILEGGLMACLFQGDQLLLWHQTSAFSSHQHETPGEISIPWGRSLNGLIVKGNVFIRCLFSCQDVTSSTGSSGDRAAWAWWGLIPEEGRMNIVCRVPGPVPQHHLLSFLHSELWSISCVQNMGDTSMCYLFPGDKANDLSLPPPSSISESFFSVFKLHASPLYQSFKTGRLDVTVSFL